MRQLANHARVHDQSVLPFEVGDSEGHAFEADRRRGQAADRHVELSRVDPFVEFHEVQLGPFGRGRHASHQFVDEVDLEAEQNTCVITA